MNSPSLLEFIFASFVTATASAAPDTLLSIPVSGAAALNQPVAVYNNWSAYDELSDNVELTESLAMKELGEILRLGREGVRIDYYLMDAFWYAPDGGYRTWRKPHWPDGPDRWLDHCHEHGLLPGLWVAVNSLCKLEPVTAWQCPEHRRA